ncbi:spoIIIJ-associated protein [Butyrivibrio sp. ob235]|uniref:RNA-binding cell elongation regulator Jag/EloR n=1 Tax=unclassified Butyrivibrio TaxID=2639466 RepID=UPI0003B3B3AF|nr:MULTISPECIES: RNA-binding cell elongation regulator Jag/EloR [unclassified Butyrivibrio]SEL64184.1 spoIIIJ-associated protein [Butyrivibrio sp. ob235]
MEYIEISKKTVDECITEACAQLMVTSDNLEYEVISTGSTGFLGLNVKPAVIRARVKSASEEKTQEVKETVEEKKVEVKKEEKPKKKEVKEEKAPEVKKEEKTEEKQISYVYDHEFINRAKEFLANVFGAMNMKVTVDAKYNETDKVLEVELSGDEMGVLIGKRGQTLDSLQYLISLVVNRGSEDYIHVKVDTENYRSRRKATLENLAKNIAYKVRKNRQSVSLEPMNPYERRIIHSALQADKYVTTHSEGEEPFRRVVVTLKK